MPKTGERPANYRPDEFYQKIVDDYIDLRERGMLRGIVKSLAETHNTRPETMSTWIRTARQRGLLEPWQRRLCPECRQPLVVETSLRRMEAAAGDFADKCRELGYPRAARLFDQAAEVLCEKELLDA